MTRLALSALLAAACGVSSEPPLTLHAENPVLESPLADAVAWWQERGYNVEVMPDGRPVDMRPLGYPGGSFGEEGIVVDSYAHWWMVGPCDGGYSIRHILRHEIGHQLGFHHVDDVGDVMNPWAVGCYEPMGFSQGEGR